MVIDERYSLSQLTHPTTYDNDKQQAPTIGLAPGEGAGAPSSYTKYVTKQFAKMEVREGLSGVYVCIRVKGVPVDADAPSSQCPFTRPPPTQTPKTLHGTARDRRC